MSGPVLIAIDSDAEALRALDAALCGRYAQDYRVECTPSALDTLALLEQLAADHEDVALGARR